MAIDLSEFDIEEYDVSVAHLTDELDWCDLQQPADKNHRESRDTKRGEE